MFERQRVESWLRDHQLRFLVDQEGSFFVDFCSEEGPDYRVQLSAEGADADVLCIRIRPDVIYSEAMRDRIEGFVAGWNRKTFWPKAFMADDWRGRGIRVVGENSFPLGPGIHHALLHNFIMVTLESGRGLIAELTATVNAADSTEFEAWLRSTEWRY
jgi:putative sensory transduction regulator